MGEFIVVMIVAAVVFFFYWIFTLIRHAYRRKFPKKLDGYYPASEIPLRIVVPDYEDSDFIERFDFAGARILAAFGDYNIIYTDRNGYTTNRNISVNRAYENNGRYAVKAFCHLRDDFRSFIDDRIEKAVDISTGEIVGNVAKHAINKYAETPEGQVLRVIDRETMALHLLAFVCRADGRMMKAERMIIADYLKRRCYDIDLDDTKLDNAIKTLGAPSKNEFKKIIADMKAAGDIDRLRDITDCAKRIVETQKTVDQLEKAAIEILEASSN